MPYNKPFLTVSEQLEQLQSRGISVTDVDRAKRDLRAINYYRLSGYLYPLRKKEPAPPRQGLGVLKSLY